MFNQSKDRGAVLVIIFDGNKVALVMEPAKPLPHYWKLPGGGIDDGDVDPDHPHDDRLAADKAAVREAREETGLDVKVRFLRTLRRRAHTVYVYVGVADFSQMVKVGGEGEIPRAFPIQELETLSTFMPLHRSLLKEAIDDIRRRRR